MASEVPERIHDCERTEDAAPLMLELACFAPCRKRVCFRRFDRRKLKTATRAALNSHARERALLLFLCILLSGCRSRQSVPGPSIEFTRVPPAAEGGPDKLDVIEGRVTGARPGQRIVLFALSGMWWVQPLAEKPFTAIQRDSTWRSSTHLGAAYAALLVDAGYRPSLTVNSLPEKGGPVLAVTTVRGATPRSPLKTIQFSGYQWEMLQNVADAGGSTKFYDKGNVWTDNRGFLHLRVTKQHDQWLRAEVKLSPSLGYGSYRFVVRDVSHLEPAAVFRPVHI